MRPWLRSVWVGACVAACVVGAWGQTAQVPVGSGAQVRASDSPQVKSTDSVTVNADRGLVGVSDSATSVAVVSRRRWRLQPGLTLDDRLHEVAGFQLFRRTSSWTANPTTEGRESAGAGEYGG